MGLINKKTPLLATKLRHVNIHQHWLRECAQEGDITVNWIPTAQRPADGLTKPLKRQCHDAFVQLIGMVDVETRIEQKS